MMNTVIQVSNLSKCYRLGEIGFRSFTEIIEHWWLKRTGRGDELHRRRIEPEDEHRIDGNRFWALRDIAFDVQQGDIVGIIGKNGAGKSTLLKILSRVTEPTTGRAALRGKVSSLLEVGTGFHPELTGRENVYLNGAIFGMKKPQIDDKFDDIVAFSEVEEFIDTPVKRYSSGMYVRLAFAVAAHLEPEIMIVDEVLAVGDASFQKKCIGKMGDVAHGGRTVLFVSHNMSAINNLCTRCLWINDGMIHMTGTPAEVVHAYLAESTRTGLAGEMDLRNWPSRYGNGEARIESARLLDEDGRVTTVLHRTQGMAVEFVIDSRCAHSLRLSVQVVADSSEKILHLAHYDTPGLHLGVLQGRHAVRFAVGNCPLCAGSYDLILAVHTEGGVPIDVVMKVLPFAAEDIVNSPRPYRTIAEHAFCWVPNTCSVTPASG